MEDIPKRKIEYTYQEDKDYSILALEEIQNMYYVFNVNEIDKDGYWQIMVYNFDAMRYCLIDDPIIYYKGHIFDSLETPPWDEERMESIKTEINIINKDGTPLCVCVYIRDLT